MSGNPLFPYIYRLGQPVFDRLFYNRYRRAAIAHATGRLLMVGLGPGTDLKFVPPAVTSISAVEPAPAFRQMASRLATPKMAEVVLAQAPRFSAAAATAG